MRRERPSRSSHRGRRFRGHRCMGGPLSSVKQRPSTMLLIREGESSHGFRQGATEKLGKSFAILWVPAIRLLETGVMRPATMKEEPGSIGMSGDTTTDVRDLIERVRAGDDPAREALLERIHHRLRRIGFSPGHPGRLPAPGSHRSVLAQLRHTAPHVTSSLRTAH